MSIDTKKFDERHSPIGRDDYLSKQHIERYKFALHQTEVGTKILDIACGVGYGTALLVKYGRKVVGADYDEPTINDARLMWNHKNFTQADALRLPFDDNEFDVIVTFETIEHVHEHEAEQFLSEMKRVLRPGGKFICSTPNILYTAHPEFHLHEYSPDEFFGLIEKFFKTYGKYAQYFTRIDRIKDVTRRKLLSPIKRMVPQNIIKFLRQNSKIGPVSQPKNKGPTKGNNRFDGWMEKVSGEAPDPVYGVTAYRGKEYCRIMIVAAENRD